MVIKIKLMPAKIKLFVIMEVYNRNENKSSLRKILGQSEITHRGSSLKCNSFTNSGSPAEKMKGRRGEGWKFGTSGLVKVGRVFFRMKFESTYDFIFLLLLKFNFIHNSGEPAAVVGPKIQIKVEAFHPTKSAAAGLLFCWLWEALK
jgi:hypothetical protein